MLTTEEQDKTKWFTDEEESLVMALARGQKTFKENDVVKVFIWAAQTRLSSYLLELILKGELNVLVKKGEVCFRSDGREGE